MSEQRDPAPRHLFLLPVLYFLLGAVVIWTFLPSLKGNFLFSDDGPYVFNNPDVKTGLTWHNFTAAFVSIGNANWHPITWLSHMLDCQLYGLNPWGHHLTNVLLHTINTLLVFLVLRKLTKATWPSWIAALFFGLHPLRVQSVAWISERKDVLSVLFWLLTIWAYARFAEEAKAKSTRTKIFSGLTLLFFVLGLMSKTMLVTMPFVLLLLDYWPLQRWQQTSRWTLIKEKLPFFIPVVLVSILSYKAQEFGGMVGEMGYFPLILRLQNVMVSYARYLGKFFWPVDLCVFYPHPGKWPLALVLAATLLVLLISAVLFLARRRFPYAYVGWFWYLGTLVPVIGVVQIGSQSMADRYTYIPMIGIVLLLVWGAYELVKQWKHAVAIMSAIVAVLTVACIAQTRNQLRYWKDDITVWNRAIAMTTNNYMAHYMLGVVLWAVPQEIAALHEFQEAVRIKPDFAPAQKFLGSALSKAQFFDEALVHFQKGLELAPADAGAWYNCGLLFFTKGQLDEAVVQFNRSLEYGTNWPSQDALDTIHRIKAHAANANTQLRDALQKDPARAESLNNLAWLLATNPDEHVRNGKEAVELALRACEATQYRVGACVRTLAAAYAEVGRFDEAITLVDSACQLSEKAGEDASLKRSLEVQSALRARRPYYAIPDSRLLPDKPLNR